MTDAPLKPAPDPVAPVLAVRAPEACRILGIGRRLLWELTNRNEIPHLRLNRAVVYPVDSLRVWLAERAEVGEA